MSMKTKQGDAGGTAGADATDRASQTQTAVVTQEPEGRDFDEDDDVYENFPGLNPTRW